MIGFGAVLLALVPAAMGPDDHGFRELDNGLRYRCVKVEGVRGVCGLLALRVGTEHDPAGATGLAHGVAAWLRALEVGELVTVHPRATTLACIESDADQVLARFRGLLAGELPEDHDRLRAAAGAAALEADNQSQILPGPSLRTVAERALLAGTPAGRQSAGIPAELRLLSPDVMSDWVRGLFRPRNAVLVLLANASEDALAERVAAALGDLPAGTRAVPAPTVHDSLPEPRAEVVHDRVAAPFVSLALRSPEPMDDGYLAFAVAMEIVAGRAVRAFRDPRGQEMWGGFPPSRFDPVEGDRVATINRRARNDETPAKARAEIESFVASLNDRVATAEEIARARSVLAGRFDLPPYQARRVTTPRSLFRRAGLLALAEIGGWPGDLRARIDAVADDEVAAVLRQIAAAEGGHWFALLPQ